MAKLMVDTNLCPQNHACPSVTICPMQALSQEGYQAPVVDAEKCIVCGLCAEKCGKKALKIVEQHKKSKLFVGFDFFAVLTDDFL